MGLAGLCHRPFGDGCTAQNAGFACVARRRRCAQTSPSSCWARLMFARQRLHGPVRALRTTECQDNHSAAGTLCVLASLPQPDLEVRSLRNAARQYPCARPSVLSPRAPNLDAGGPTMKSGTVSIVGRPNSGKSTLVNALVGQKISIVSDKPQTTRHRILGVRTEERGQIAFVDTPGVHKPAYAMNRRMLRAVHAAVRDVDLVLLVVDASVRFGAA